MLVFLSLCHWLGIKEIMQITEICLKESAVTRLCLGMFAAEMQLTCFSFENQDFCSIKHSSRLKVGES